MISTMKKRSIAFRSNVRLARSLWGVFSTVALERLKRLTEKYGFSVAAGDLQLLEGRWYVTSAGLLRLAQRRRCPGIKTRSKAMCPIPTPIDGSSKQPFTRLLVREGSSATAMPIPQMFLLWSAAPRCAWRKPGPSTARCARPTESASARLRSLGISPRLLNPLRRKGSGHSSFKWERFRQWPAPTARSTLPSDSPASTRSRHGQALCR